MYTLGYSHFNISESIVNNYFVPLLRNKINSPKIDYDIEFADEILIDKYKEISKCNDEDIISVGN